MAERSQYFDSVSYGSAYFARHFNTICGTGYVLGNENELEVRETSPTSLGVLVSLGAGWIEGRYFEVYIEPEEVELDNASSEDRIDRIVARLDLNNRLIELDSLTGTAGSSPSPPSLTRTSSVYEISLAQVYVSAGTTTIGDEDITDERDDDNVCGVSEHSSAGTSQAASFSEIQTYLALSKSGSSDGAETLVEWDTVSYDTDNIFTAPDTEIVIPSDGVWGMSFKAEIRSATILNDPQQSFEMQVEEIVNGSTVDLWEFRLDTSGILESSDERFNLTPVKYLTENDVLEFSVDLNNSTSDSFDFDCYIEVYKLLNTTL